MLHLVTGGSGSGKSAFAEELICSYYREENTKQNQKNLLYIATMIPYGQESKEKIRCHRNMRKDKGFETVECYKGLREIVNAGKIPDKSYVLLECMSNLLANEMYEPGGAGKNAVQELMKGVCFLEKNCAGLIVVTNEVFGEYGKDSEEMSLYKQRLAQINKQTAVLAESVTEVVCGIPVVHKGKPLNLPVKNTGHLCMAKRSKGRLKVITGGVCQGKLAYAKRMYGDIQWIDGADCSFEEIYRCKGIYHFEKFLWRMLTAGQKIDRLAEQICDRNPEIIIVTSEIGCGLVPTDKFMRIYREKAGRVCTRLASAAQSVDRVIYGIGIRIKEEKTDEPHRT